MDSTPSTRFSGESISYSSSLGVLTTSTSVPESSTTLGLFLVGGLLGISRYAKTRQGK